MIASKTFTHPSLSLLEIKELLTDINLKDTCLLFKKLKPEFGLYKIMDLNKILALMNRKVAELSGCFNFNKAGK